MTNLVGDEETYSTRLQLELKGSSSTAASDLVKDLESVVAYRKDGKITATEFLIQLKRIECAFKCSNGVSKESLAVFVHEELELSRASNEIISRVSRLLGNHAGDITSSVRSEVADYCAVAWRSALSAAERDAKGGRVFAQVLFACLIVYLLITKSAPLISEARYPFSADIVATSHRPFWDLMTEAANRVMSVFATSTDLVAMILGVAGAALNLFRKGIRSFEMNLMFREHAPRPIAVYLAIGAWSGFVASYLLREFSEAVSGQALRSFITVVGCFAAGYSSWFVDTAMDKLWKKLEVTQRPGAST